MLIELLATRAEFAPKNVVLILKIKDVEKAKAYGYAPLVDIKKRKKV